VIFLANGHLCQKYVDCGWQSRVCVNLDDLQMVLTVLNFFDSFCRAEVSVDCVDAFSTFSVFKVMS